MGETIRTTLRRQPPSMHQDQFSPDFTTGTREPIPNYPYMPTDELVLQTQRLLDGAIIDWEADDVIEQMRKQSDPPLSIVNRLFYTATNIAGPESEAAFTAVTKRLQAYDRQEAERLWAPNPRKRLSFYFTATSAASTADYHNQHSPAIDQFMDELAHQTRIIKRQLLEPAPRDLLSFMRLVDAYIESSEKRKLTKSLRKSIIQTIKDNEVPQLIEIADDLYKGLTQGWILRKKGWDVQDIADMISELPHIRRPSVRQSMIAGLEENIAAAMENPAHQTNVSFDAQGITSLLSFSWAKLPTGEKEGLAIKYLSDKTAVAQALQPQSVPIEFLPSVALQVLVLAETQLPQGEYQALLHAVGEEAVTQQETAIAWAIALATLRKIQPGISELATTLLRKNQAIPPQVQQILLDETPGSIWLKPPAKLIYATPGQHYQNAHLLYESEAQAKVVEQPQPHHVILRPVRAERNGTAIVSREIQVPLLGTSNLVKDDVTCLFADKMAKAEFDANVLATDFSMLQNRFRHQNLNPNYAALYIADLYRSERMEAAKALGIEAVYVDDNPEIQGVTFVVDQQLAQNGHAKSSQPMVFQGDLLRSGVMLFTGIPKENPLAKFLNNLALELSMRTHYHIDAESPFDKEIQKELTGVIKPYNHADKKPFPMLGPALNTQPIIPVSLKNFGNVSVAMGPRFK